MVKNCIYSIDITTNNRDVISISSDDFNHFYIANINDLGDEIQYTKKNNSKVLQANFFMLKIIKNEETSTFLSIDRLKKRKDIIKVKVNFTNGSHQEFELSVKRALRNGYLENTYEEIYMDNEDLCVLITDKAIKYKEGLFA